MRPVGIAWFLLACIVAGCGPMDPPMQWELYRLRDQQGVAAKIEILTVSHTGWGKKGYSSPPRIRVCGQDGSAWVIEIYSNDPATWEAFRITSSGKPEEAHIDFVYARSVWGHPHPPWGMDGSPERDAAHGKSADVTDGK